MIFKLYVWLQELSFDFSEWMIRIPIRKACRMASKAFKSQQLSDYDLAIRVMSASIKRLPGESMAKNHANHLLGRLNEGRKRALAAMMQQSAAVPTETLNGLPATMVNIEETNYSSAKVNFNTFTEQL